LSHPKQADFRHDLIMDSVQLLTTIQVHELFNHL